MFHSVGKWIAAPRAHLRNARKPPWLQVRLSSSTPRRVFDSITPTDGSRDVFVHVSAVERAGMSALNEGHKVSYEVVTERGKQAAANLQAA